MAATVALGQQLGAGSSVDVELGADFVSHYVWRGQLLTDGPVIQPSVTASWRGLRLNVWASVDATDVNEQGSEHVRIQEVDYTLSYTFSPVEGLDLAGGLIEYDFPGTRFDATQELFASASASAVPLAPTLALYYDIDEVNGVYANFSVGHTFEVSEKLGLGVGAGAGWADADYNFGYFGVHDGAAGDVSLSAGLEYAVSEKLSVSGYVGYTELIEGDIEDAVSDSDVLLGGVRVTISF
jgi:hypothetical protein